MQFNFGGRPVIGYSLVLLNIHNFVQDRLQMTG